MVEESQYTHEVDIWSLGVLAYELVVGKPCFETTTNAATMDKIAKVELKFPANMKLSGECRDFVSRILAKNPEQRPNWQDLLAHPWLKCAKKNKR